MPLTVALRSLPTDHYKQTYSDLKEEIGSKSLVSQILSGQCSLSITHIKTLSAKLVVKPE